MLNLLVGVCSRLKHQKPVETIQSVEATPSSSSPTFATVLEEYAEKLDYISTASESGDLLPVLLQRDQVQKAFVETGACADDTMRHFINLDQELVDLVKKKSELLKPLSRYRRTFLPSDTQWWWYLDIEAAKRAEKGDLPWRVGSVLLFTITGAFALEILKRLLVDVPDTLSFLGTLLTLVLTGSVFTAQSRDIGQWFLERVLKQDKESHAEAEFIMAGIAASLVIGLWWLGMPQLARYYNNKAIEIGQKNWAEAASCHRRAAALAPDDAEPCYNLGRFYEMVGQQEEAITWYQQALERDMDFSNTYNGLGRMFILQEDYRLAVQILLTGLNRIATMTEPVEIKNEIRYRLLQNLGWAYYASGEYSLAREKLETAVALENDKINPVEIEAPPHYFLALTLEELGLPELACEHWDLSQRYPDSEFLYQEGWDSTIREKVQHCP